MSIDWSKAPEGATAWDARPHADQTWMRRNWRPNRGWDYWGMNHWIYYGEIPEDQERQMIHRPSPQSWNGEGLPPVGIDCERMWVSGPATYTRVRVIAHDDGQAIYRFMEDRRKGQVQADKQGDGDSCGNPIFRPIRTPEQIAADEKGDAIREMIRVWRVAPAGSEFNNAYELASMLYDAGYRKQPAP